MAVGRQEWPRFCFKVVEIVPEYNVVESFDKLLRAKFYIDNEILLSNLVDNYEIT